MALFVILAGLLLASGMASAADDPLKITMDLSQYEFSEPCEITVSIRVSNTGSTGLPGAVTLYDPDKKQITEFGEPVLSAGEQKSWTGTWKVTQEQLQEGRICFRVQYSVTGDDGNVMRKAKNFAKAITFTGDGKDAGAAPEEAVTEQPVPAATDNSQLISLSVEAMMESEIFYELPSTTRLRVQVTNNSPFDVENVRVTASGLTLYTFPTILAGETREFVRDISIQMPGKFQFVASCRSQLGQTVSFNSNIIQVLRLTPTPVPTPVPTPTPTEAPSVPAGTSNALTYLAQIPLFSAMNLLIGAVMAFLSLVP